MRYVLSLMLAVGLFTVLLAPDTGVGSDLGVHQSRVPLSFQVGLDPAPASRDSDEIVQEYCVRCHNDRMLRGNLSLERFTVDSADETGEVAESMIRKLRAGMMPPPGSPRPPADSLLALVESIETRMDDAAEGNSNPGGRSFQRLNRAEYQASVRDVLDLEIEAALFLPLDTKSANFDNIADVQMLSPTILDAYLRAADEISRLAVGVPNPSPNSITYTNSGYVSQWDRMPGAPRGTRGGISVTHNFPADGEYRLRLWFEHTTMGEMFGRIKAGESIDVSIDGERVALIDVDRWLSTSDPNGASMETDTIFVSGGPHRVSAAFIKLADGPVEDLTSPHDWSLVDRQVGVNGYGITALAHLKDLVVLGPYNPSGLSDTPSRRAVFSCRPTSSEEERPCAGEIVTRLGSRAFRRPLTSSAFETLMTLYDQGAATGGFEEGVRTALQGILAMPDFVFRFEEAPAGLEAGETYRISDNALASRLSFFLWGSPPDDELLQVAGSGRLAEDDVLEAQTRRMLADPRAFALASRFAAQWLRLEDLEKVHPDRLLYPDFYQQLADDMLLETELFFNGLVRDDASVLDLFNADYTFVNERLARHYGIPGVTGEEFRRVAYPDDRRKGIFGHGSVLTLTSHAGRTSPVLRGKWVMEVLLGTPPPPPPPGVPDLDQTGDAVGGRMLTTRERMEMHRSDPACSSCHRFMDPIGLALDNFDVTGRWRIKENGMALDTRGELYDGTPVTSPEDLRQALMARPIPLVRNFTENLMAYALGRRLEYFDMPRVRQITRAAEENDHRMSSYIMGVITSDAFQMQQVPDADSADTGTRN
jgi:hypothetical protein